MGSRRSIQVLVVVGLLGAVAVGFLQRGRQRSAAESAFPEVQGRLRVGGLAAPLELLRDARGIPHIEAAEQDDAFFGLGFVHAQDRLAQMQWLLRLARGTSAEWVGAQGLEADRWARTLDLAGLAEQDLEAADAATLRMLEAYARGVNARIERIRSGRVAAPVALTAAGAALPIADWRPADSLAVLKAWAWGISGSVEASLALDDLLARLGGEAAQPFFPRPSEGGRQAPGAPVTASLWRDPLRRALGLEGRSAGSSAWVLGGAHTRSGRPLLAGDSHVAPTAPPLLYVAHLRAPELDVAGSTLPGVPAFWTGHNPKVAWASTHARAAVVDLYRETLTKKDSRYHDGGGWRPLEQRSEVIAVRGRDEVVLEVRSTRHGPLLDGLVSGERDPIALAWVGQLGKGAGTLTALREVARAADAAELRAALAALAEPPLVFVYADADGAAGLQMAGWIPQRPLGNDLVPVPGRARWYDWNDPVPFESLPHLELEGGRGWLVAADGELAPRGEEEPVQWLWRDGTRTRRIESRLRDAAEQGPVSLRQLTRFQSDVREARGPELVEAALRLAGAEGLGPEAREVAALLRGWNGEATPESSGAAVYHVFSVALTETLFRERLGDDLYQRYLAVTQADPVSVVAGIVAAAARSGGPGKGSPSGWSDPDRVAEAVRSSLRETWFRLSYRLGGSRAKWRWGRLHRVAFQPFVPWERSEALGPWAVGGSGSTVNTQEYALGDPFAVRLCSAFRFAADAAALDRSLVALAPGQSEHPGHPHRADGVSAWLEGAASVLPTARILVEEAAVHTLLLEPAP